MLDYLKKLLDEENRQADIALLSVLIGIVMSVTLSVFILIPSIMVTWKTGKIDSGSLSVLGMWMSVAFGAMAVDKFRRPTTAPTPPTIPTPPATVPTTTAPAPIPSPPQPQQTDTGRTAAGGVS